MFFANKLAFEFTKENCTKRATKNASLGHLQSFKIIKNGSFQLCSCLGKIKFTIESDFFELIHEWATKAIAAKIRICERVNKVDRVLWKEFKIYCHTLFSRCWAIHNDRSQKINFFFILSGSQCSFCCAERIWRCLKLREIEIPWIYWYDLIFPT